MPADIFNLFANSLETVAVKQAVRGTMGVPTGTSVNLQAVVKRRNSMAEATNQSEDYNNQTTIHFKASDKEYINIGAFAQVDGEWHTIEQVRDGKNFDTGKTEFYKAYLANDIQPTTDDPVWGGISA